jgi:hypothetical protein
MPISLTAGQTETQSVGGVTVDTANAAVASQLDTDFGGTLTFVLAKGTPATNAFSGSARAKDVIVTINLANGVWFASNGTSGTLSAGALTSVLNQLRSFRNQIETFGSNNVFPGAGTVAWT